jgi:hypothetical protein
MAQFNVQEAKTGPFECKSILGAAVGDPNINLVNLAGDDWWQPMTEEETNAFLEGSL